MACEINVTVKKSVGFALSSPQPEDVAVICPTDDAIFGVRQFTHQNLDNV